MPKAGERRDDKADVYANVPGTVTQLVAGETAEKLMVGESQCQSGDRRQASEQAELICKTNVAAARLIESGFQQALDMLWEFAPLHRILNVILRERPRIDRL